MKKFLLISLLSMFFYKANSQYIQGYCYLWYFGDYAGISFNSYPPEPLLNGSMSTTEACSSMGKGTEIYFYTDGMRVWNREHELMPNGTDLAGHPSSAQGALSVPVPGSSNLFYIFTTDANENVLESGLRYSVVDIFLDEFKGDVTDEKDILLHPQVAEKIALVPHANNHYFWVIAIQWESNNFLAYLITDEGISTEPVVSTTGFYYDYGPPSPNGNICGDAVGYLKASPDGNKLATVHHTQSKVEIYDFDRNTGVVSNPLTSPAIFSHPYGVAFSPNSRYLYISTVYANSKIFQIDTHHPDCYNNIVQIAAGGVI